MKRAHSITITASVLTVLFGYVATNIAVGAGERGLGIAPAPARDNVRYEDWVDKVRNRAIPVKMYLPQTTKYPVPVVIFSHGLGGSREAASYFGEGMSEHGYFVIHIQHPGSDEGIWKGGGITDRAGLMSKFNSAANGENLISRTQDVSFVIDELERRSKSDPQLKGKLDLSKLALAGHSFGAGTTMAIAGQNFTMRTSPLKDKRVKAAIYMSPPVNLYGRTPEQVYGAIDIPGLLMTGTKDTSPVGREQKAEDRLLPFEGIGRGDQYLVNFIDGTHGIFGGRSGTKYGADNEFHPMINKVCLAFLDSYLKDDAAQKQWLKQDCSDYLKKSAYYKFK